jgi:hypothetical protein
MPNGVDRLFSAEEIMSYAQECLDRAEVALTKQFQETSQLKLENMIFRKALEEIFTCESHHPGDVVDIAKHALALIHHS